MDTAKKQMVDRLYRAGVRAQVQGDLETARTQFKRMAETVPRSSEAVYRLGLVDLAAGDPQAALDQFARALRLNPKRREIWSSAIDALLPQKDMKALERLMRDAQAAGLPRADLKILVNKIRGGGQSGVADLGEVPPQEFQAAARAYGAREFRKAERAALSMQKRYPPAAPVLALLGACQAALGNAKASEATYREAIKLDPAYAEAHVQLGQLLIARGRSEDALGILERAVELSPDAPLPRKLFGVALQHVGLPTTAVEQLTRAREAMPNDLELLYTLADAARGVRKLDLADDVSERLISLAPTQLQALVARGRVLDDLDRNDEAVSLLSKALEQDPKCLPALVALAALHRKIGQIEAARKYAAAALRIEPNNAAVFLLYVNLAKTMIDDPVVADMAGRYERAGFAPSQFADVAHALAKSAEDSKRDDLVFGYLGAAKRALRQALSGDLRPTSFPDVPVVRAALDEGLPLCDASEEVPVRPVFVAGMPRSGTTLVEAIIASHSAVTAGGELSLAATALRDAISRSGDDPKAFAETDFGALGRSLSEAYAGHAKGKPVVTDKGLFGFCYIGLLPHLFPDARVIVVRRDPRDNCLSMYKNRFRDTTHRYTLDLEVLGETYLEYLRILDGWRDTHGDRFLEVRYEDLIASPEAVSRQIIDACGLEWEEACLDFYRNDSAVRTISASQVRQPIYASSVGAWRRFEDGLAPLIRILRDGGALPD
jgi:tetratricopeptide (TPR) repeat protein